MRGVWIIEIAELDAIGRAEVSRIKAFLSRTVDRYRPPYERYVIDVPASACSPAASTPTPTCETNRQPPLWPVRCGTIDLDALGRDRDQLWAEAVARFRAGAYLVDRHDRSSSLPQESSRRSASGRRLGRPDRPLDHPRSADRGRRRLRSAPEGNRPEAGSPRERLDGGAFRSGDRPRTRPLGPGGADAGLGWPQEPPRAGSATAKTGHAASPANGATSAAENVPGRHHVADRYPAEMPRTSGRNIARYWPGVRPVVRRKSARKKAPFS